MSLPEKWPYRVKNGNSTVPIYYRETSKGYDEFKVAWYDAEHRMKFKSFADFEEAKKYAGSVNAAISKGDVQALTLTSNDRLSYLRAVESLKGLEVPLDWAVNDYTQARSRLGGHTLQEAVDCFLKSRPNVTPKHVATVVAELIAEKRTPKKKTKKPASKRYLADLESRLGRFRDAFNLNIGEIQAEQVEAFLDGLDVAGRTYFNYARTILTLFNFAKAKKYYPTERNPFEGFEDVLEYEDESEIEIFTADELRHFLAHARPELVPFLAIGAFAGLRHAEIARLEWQDITATHIRLHRDKTKTRQRRLVEIQPNLAQWLAPYRRESGLVCPIGNIPNAIQDLCADSKATWKHNALRHSAISYRLALTDNENLVATEAGNSPMMIHRHYKQLVTKADAEAWFSILPRD
jgi:integrase